MATSQRSDQLCELCFSNCDPRTSWTYNANNTTRYAHMECLREAKVTKQETFLSVYQRAVTSTRKCSWCAKQRASIACIDKGCTNYYHLPCAKQVCQILIEMRCYVCRTHRESTSKYKKELCNWPEGKCSQKYLLENKWENVPCWVRQKLEQNCDKFDQPPLKACQDVSACTRVNEISPGHWAWCPDLAKTKRHQFELVANKDIDMNSIILEYIGVVRYDTQEMKSPYVTQLNVPAEIDLGGSLVVDGSEFANESCFINSVSSSTPSHLKRNSAMYTVWCKGQLRVLVYSVEDIPAHHPLILDYNEFGETFFEPSVGGDVIANNTTDAKPTVDVSDVVYVGQTEEPTDDGDECFVLAIDNQTVALDTLTKELMEVDEGGNRVIVIEDDEPDVVVLRSAKAPTRKNKLVAHKLRGVAKKNKVKKRVVRHSY